MRTLICSLAAVLSLGLAGCGGDEEPLTAENVEEAITSEIEEQTGATPANSAEPCELLSDELLRSHFEIADDAEISRRPSKYSPQPLCTVTWAKPNAAELEEQRSKAMSDYMMKKARGEDVKIPSLRTDNEVTLTLYEPLFDDDAQAMQSFESSMRRLQEGITGSHEDVEVTFQADVAQVDGVGDKAMWAAKMRQLSVVDGRRIFHLGVNTGAGSEQDRDKAAAVARDIAEQI